MSDFHIFIAIFFLITLSGAIFGLKTLPEVYRRAKLVFSGKRVTGKIIDSKIIHTKGYWDRTSGREAEYFPAVTVYEPIAEFIPSNKIVKRCHDKYASSKKEPALDKKVLIIFDKKTIVII